ncbi:TIGR02757 family protein [Nonlabens arenilitoris]|uniref:TIGR02757 family protein n=1 Tax=Nonlabens arenilitoris TaxID=1217969 RepID=A0A2S7UEB8_9FLAO|nr:TIGR02757 family protein [Nonlabens arenilitoris]PQJ32633.1 TIGR02757 family protein [Nonlabens arenilitoris]
MTRAQLKEYLDAKVEQYNVPDFIPHDPIQIPHLFTEKKDIEIAGFLVATISWGNRKSIINNSNKLMELMDHAPADFIINHEPEDLDRFDGFVHRTFNNEDCKTFLRSLKNIEQRYGGLENAFAKAYKETGHLQKAISSFKKMFFEIEHLPRTQKHVSDPLKNSSAKRINMFLRWMVRNDNAGVDFGIWKQIPMSALSLPLDVHTGNIARKLKMLKRKQNDGKAVAELDNYLRKLDPNDPVKYDFALFGVGVFNDL